MSDDLVLVGRLGRPHGLAGFLVLIPESDNDGRFLEGAELLLGPGRSVVVRRTLSIPGGRALAFVGFNDRTAAEVLRGADLFVVASDRRRLDHDEFWPDELTGLSVRSVSGLTLGRVEEVDDTSAQARLMIATSTGVFMVPLVAALVPEVSVAEGYLVVADLPGLLEIEGP